MLTDEQIERYSRQIILPQIGGRGQQKLLSAAVAIVGTGEPGTTAALYVAAAGIGRVSVRAPVAAAIAELNPDCHAQPLAAQLNTDAAMAIARSHDLVIDADLSGDTSLLLNIACLAMKRQVVWGHLSGSGAQATILAGHQADAPCYGCVRMPPPAPPSAVGPLTAAFIGTVLATEAIKILLGIGSTLIGRMLMYDARDSTVSVVPVRKDPRCATCSALGMESPVA